MSRIGRKPVQIPKGVSLELQGNMITVKGTKGSLVLEIPEGVSVKLEDGVANVERSSDEKSVKSLHGLIRMLISNMISGVTNGFEKKLEIIGVGYRAQVNGSNLNLALGFSHPVEMKAPAGISMEMDKVAKNVLIIRGMDKQLVGQFAANIRKLRKPEPYKGKGIRYVDEYVARKAGKTAKK